MKLHRIPAILPTQRSPPLRGRGLKQRIATIALATLRRPPCGGVD